MRIQEYLAGNQAALDTTVSSLAESLATEHDSDKDRRGIARDTYKALKLAIGNLLRRGFREGPAWGAHGDIAVMIYQPKAGGDLFGRFNVQAGRLFVGSTIPCPSDWPTGGAKLSPFLESMLGATAQPKSGTRVVTVDVEGGAFIGASFGDRQYLVDSLPGDEMWWRPLEDVDGEGG